MARIHPREGLVACSRAGRSSAKRRSSCCEGVIMLSEIADCHPFCQSELSDYGWRR